MTVSVYEPIEIGTFFDGEKAELNLTKANNFHMLAVGYSGAGKTFTIKKLVKELLCRGQTVFLIDAQGDFDEIDGVPSSMINTIDFKYVGGNGTINPLSIPNHPDSGGVFMSRRQLIEVIKIFNPSLGSRQVNDLQKLITAVYEDFGIIHDDPTTWHNPPPTLEDLRQVVLDKIKVAQSGISDNIFVEIRKLRKQLIKDKAKMERNEENGKETTDIDNELFNENLDSLKEKACEIIESEVNGRSHTTTDWNLGRLEAIEHTLHGMTQSQLFGEDNITPRKNCINRFLITGLHEVDQQIMFHLLLDRVFTSAMRMAQVLNKPEPDMFVILDEGKLAAVNARNDLSPLNRISTEGRKYGLGSIVGIQTLSQVTDDMRDNYASVFLLPVSHQRHDEIKRKLRVSSQMLGSIKARSDALFSINNSPFKPLHLFR